MEILKFDWRNDTRGSIAIVMDEFFPCSKTKIKKLLKLVNFSDCSQDLVKQIEGFLSSQLLKFKSQAKQYSNDYLSHHQNVTDLSEIIESGRYPNGVQVRPNELRGLKQDLCQEKSDTNKALRAFKHIKKTYEQCEMNIEIIEQVL